MSEDRKCQLDWCFSNEKGNCKEGIPSDKRLPECSGYEFDEKKVRAKYPIIQKGKGDLKYRSIAFSDTPKCLYRFLYIWEPATLDFSDMYNSRIALIDLNGAAIAKLAFFKYELAAYFYVPKDDLIVKPVPAIATPLGPLYISSGIPGIEDDDKYRPQLVEGSKAEEEIQAFIALLEQEHDVYPGNNFRV